MKKTFKNKYYTLTFTWEPEQDTSSFWDGYVERMMEEAMREFNRCSMGILKHYVSSDKSIPFQSYEHACMYVLASGIELE